MPMMVAQLKEYLGIVVDMERNIFLREQTERQLAEQITALGKPRTIKKELQEPKKPQRESASLEGRVICAIISIICLAEGIACLAGNSSLALLEFALAIVFFFLAAAVFSDKGEFAEDRDKKYMEAIAEYERAVANYGKAVAEYETKVKAERDRVTRELSEKAALETMLAQLQEDNALSKKRLSEIYDRNIIFPKYRNLVMVSSLYEYVCAGRCVALEGHEGAYNILEMEIRLDRIVLQLDHVIAHLAAIQQNQYMLYSSIEESNRRSTQLLVAANKIADRLQVLDRRSEVFQMQLTDLQKSSALGAYHTERVQKELAYMNRMDYLTGRNDGVFYNLPPY